jgi:hypothetical protein
MPVGVFYMNRIARVFVSLTQAAPVAFALLGQLMAQQVRMKQYDVVPPVWITPDGDPDHSVRSNAGDRIVAFVFPSLSDSDPAEELEFDLPKFFLPSNRFRKEGGFDWSVGPGTDVRIVVTRNEKQAKATINIDPQSMAHIRRLDWGQFQHLQEAFRNWLCKQSNCWLFGGCESRFTNLHDDLIKAWKDNVLAKATFRRFSGEYLKFRSFPDEDPNTAPPEMIAYSGKVSAIEAGKTAMFVTRIVPGQQLAVTWGNDNLYAAPTGIMDSYSRMSSGGRTELRVVSDNGMRLFPAGSCGMAGAFQLKNTWPKAGLLPFPQAWVSLFVAEFVPIYNLFDLHNSALLAVSKVPPDPPACPDNTRKAPSYLFLLSPAAYLKADIGPAPANMAQFENEARPAFFPKPTQATSREDLNMLARQFLIVGCDSSDRTTLNGEWNHLLEISFAALPETKPDAPTGPRTCGAFVNGIFAGKSFVELRHHFSMNGRPVESGALNLETIGQLLAGPFAAHVNREGAPDSAPLVEVFRSPDPEKNRTGAGVLRIRFHTTMSRILDQVHIFEGDEIHVGSIPESLR